MLTGFFASDKLVSVFMNPKLFRFFGIFLAILLLVGGGYFVWDRYLSEAGKARRFAEEQMETYQKVEKAYVEAMTADTYGGKTPQETLDMFVEALRVGDAELASKYFLLDENSSREKWAAHLANIQDRDLLEKMASDIKIGARPLGSVYENNFAFGLFNDNGVVGVKIDMRLNQYTGIWKIESL